MYIVLLNLVNIVMRSYSQVYICLVRTLSHFPPGDSYGMQCTVEEVITLQYLVYAINKVIICFQSYILDLTNKGNLVF